MEARDLTTEQIFDYQIKTRPSIWAQYYTGLRGRPYRFEQLNQDGSYDLRKPRQIPQTDKSIGIRGQRQLLQQILDDQHPHKSTQKSRQCGMSENEVREVLWFGDKHDYTKCVYVFPTFDQVADFSRTRIEEVMKDSPYIKSRMGIDPVTGKKKQGEDITDNVRLRRIGTSFIFFRSGHTAKAGEGIDCDMVVFDEIDRMAPNVMIAFSESLSSSAYGWRRDVSTPSLPGVGVNASFKDSDQQHWFMKCPHCGNWFTMIHDFPKGVIELSKDSRGVPNHNLHLKYPGIIEETDTHAYVCLKCGHFITDETRMKGIWRPLYPYKTGVRGYQISQLYCPWISASQLMKKKNDYNLDQLFENYVIGRPYLGDNIMISKADIMRCIDTSLKSPYDIRRRSVCQGVDWGNQSWGIIGMQHPDNPEKTLILDIWSAEDSEATVSADGRKSNPHIQRTGEKMRQWEVETGVFDAGYGKDRNFELMQDFPGRVFSCFYPNLASASTTKVNDIWNEEDSKVSVDRTLTLETMAKMFRDGKIVIPLWVSQSPFFGTFIKHLTNIVLIRDIVEDEKTKKEQIVVRVGTLPGGDHFAHAMNYLTIALRKEKRSGGSFFIG